MKSREIIANVLIFGGLAIVLVWVALKVTGVINTPPLVESAPLLAFAGTIGGLVINDKNISKELASFKTSVREGFRNAREDVRDLRKEMAKSYAELQKELKSNHKEIISEIRTIDKRLVRLETKLEAK